MEVETVTVLSVESLLAAMPHAMLAFCSETLRTVSGSPDGSQFALSGVFKNLIFTNLGQWSYIFLTNIHSLKSFTSSFFVLFFLRSYVENLTWGLPWWSSG